MALNATEYNIEHLSRHQTDFQVEKATCQW